MGASRGQLILDIGLEVIVDNFCGGGGASEGIYMALGRHVDIAINHDELAIRMHEVNHPQTRHERADVFEVDPVEVTDGRPVGLVWLSPDCRHFSRARNGKPREKNIRSLPWVTLKWGGKKKPRVIGVENVVELQTWSRLVAMRDPATGRVLRKDGTVAPKGERTPVQDQMQEADKRRSGTHFRKLISELKAMGYDVEYRELTASDYGVPTTRKRLFILARCDGKPIVWPEVTHGNPKSLKVQAGVLKPWRTAAECLDFGLPCHSVFLSKEEGRAARVRRPLAAATMSRVGKAVFKYVVDCAKPFIVKGARGLAGAGLVTTGYGERKGQSARVPAIDAPLGTVVAGGGKHALVTAMMVKHFGGVVGFGLEGEALHTVTAKDHHALVLAELRPADQEAANDGSLVASNIVKMRGTNLGHATDEPLQTVSAQGTHFAEVRTLMEKIAGKDFKGDPTLVKWKNTWYRIVDIGMRMVRARELYTAMGFPRSYIIGDDASQGLSLTAEAQIRMVGNSVPPPLVKAIVEANCQEMAIRKAA